EVDDVLAGVTGIDAQLSGQVADPAPDRRVASALAEDRAATARRPDEVEKEADRRGLAGPVGAEVAEDLAATHLQVEVLDRGDGAESLRESVGGDGRLGRHSACCCTTCWSITRWSKECFP